MKTNAFDIRRFWQTLKWTVLTERKGLLTIAAGFLAAFLAIQLFTCFTVFDMTSGLGREAAAGGIVSCMSVFSFMQYYYASGVLGNAREARQRTTVLMLPASSLEKFTARLIFCMIVIPLLLTVVLLAATGLRMLLELMAGHSGIAAGFISADAETDFSFYLLFIAGLWSMSLYVLGGVFFRQRPFIWTSVTLFAASLLLSTLLFYIGVMIGEDGLRQLAVRLGLKDGSFDFDTFELVVSCVLTAFTAFNVWLSYRLYCRLQVVQHKWFNL